ncbi:glycosyltransferase [Corynebacterium sp. USCH3]|uniref:glycosyltransferase n=1 Tax=Corynebacterium sp. USCH3 TaxID=3024840 RepID=UPI0030A82911
MTTVHGPDSLDGPDSPTGTVAAISVVMPVHNEASTVAPAVRAIIGASRKVNLPVTLTVVFDRCTDSSEAQVDELRAACVQPEIRTLSGYFPHVNAARNAGVADAAVWGASAGVALGCHWTAHTDPGSLVPPHWLSHLRDAADAGHDLVIGVVHPTDDETPHAVLPGQARPSLGVRLDTLLAVGGFADTATDGDLATVRRLKELGVPWTATEDGQGAHSPTS